MVSAAPEVFAGEGIHLTGFEPNGARAAFLDRRMIEIIVNDTRHSLDNVPEDMPLLWVLRERIGLTGTKFGCGGGFCGGPDHGDNGQLSGDKGGSCQSDE